MFLKNYWLENPKIGLRKATLIVFAQLFLFVFGFFANEFWFVLITAFGILLFVPYLLYHIYYFGFYHRVYSSVEKGESTDIYDYLLPGDRSANRRFWRVNNKGIYSSIYLNYKKRNQSCYMPWVVGLASHFFRRRFSRFNFLVLGGAGCSVPMCLAGRYGRSEVDVLEIDEKKIYLAEEYFLSIYGKNVISNIKLINKNAHTFVGESVKKYDFIFQDLFVGQVAPFRFTNLEWLKKLKKLLTPKGVTVINFGGIGSKINLSQALGLFGTKKIFKSRRLFLFDANLVGVFYNGPVNSKEFIDFEKYEVAI